MGMEDWLESFSETASFGDAVKVETAEDGAARKVSATLTPDVLKSMEEYAEVDDQIKSLEKTKKELKDHIVGTYGTGAVVLGDGRVFAVTEARGYDTTQAAVAKLVPKLVDMEVYDDVSVLSVDVKKLKALADEDHRVKSLLKEKTTVRVIVQKSRIPAK